MIAIYNTEGDLQCKYNYDAWGNHRVGNARNELIYDSATGIIATGYENHIAILNPIRYRGYYYDTETGLYYLQSRYYDATLCRFLNRDNVNYLEPESIHGINLYAFCNNNPVMFADPSGHFAMPNWLKWSVWKGAFVGNLIGTYGDEMNVTKKNTIYMIHKTTSLIKNQSVGAFIGNISYTCTTQIGYPKTFYSFSNHGDDGEWSVGVGINALNWLGLDMYYSSNLGFGGNMQLTPFSTFGGEISYKEGISLSIGVINGDTTHEINFNIGWGTIISAAAIAVAVIIYLIYILYWWFCVKKYRIEIDDGKVYIETLFERMEIQMKDIEKYSYKRYRRSPLFKFYLFAQGKRYLIYTRFKWELEIILNDNNVEQV